MLANPVTFPLVSAQVLNAGVALYTCPSATRARITMLSFLNTTGTARTLSVYIVRSGAAAAAASQIWNAVSIPVTTTAPRGVICYEAINQVLNPGDFIWADSDADAAITPNGSVVEFS